MKHCLKRTRRRTGILRQGRWCVQGVTIIELLVVLAVIGILAAIAVPNIRRDVPQVREVSRIVAADLNRARSEAIRLNTTLALSFDLADNSYKVYRDADRDRESDDGSYLFERQLASEFPLANLHASTFPNHTIWFDVRGLPRNATGGFGAGTLTVRSKQDENYLLQVVMASQGRVQVVKP